MTLCSSFLEISSSAIFLPICTFCFLSSDFNVFKSYINVTFSFVLHVMSLSVRILLLISVFFSAASDSSLCLNVFDSTSSGSRSFYFLAAHGAFAELTTYSWFSFMMPLE